MSTAEDDGFSIRRLDGDDEVILQAVGELDIHSCPELDRAVTDVAGATRLVLDLSGLSFIDSAGLRVILQAEQTSKAAGGKLVVRAPSPPVRRLFEITGLDDALTVIE
jgi:anti-anti-sigma factor